MRAKEFVQSKYPDADVWHIDIPGMRVFGVFLRERFWREREPFAEASTASKAWTLARKKIEATSNAH